MNPRARPASLGVEHLEAREVPAAYYETLPALPFSDPATYDNARAIVVRGQQVGRRTDAFIKVGDSNSSNLPYNTGFLDPLGQPGYNPVFSGLAAVRPDLVNTLATFLAVGSPGTELEFAL